MPSIDAPITLIVFSDDWGRHPSSCQHLVGHLLDRFEVLWVNTIGTRRPSLTFADMRRVAGKLRQWTLPRAKSSDAVTLPRGLRTVNPGMYPGFRGGWQRRLNERLIRGKVHAALGPRKPGEQRIAITTLPITADLMGTLDVDRWVYYCVDDFSVWPGLDAQVMQAMEEQVVARADAVVAVSPTLQARLAGMGKASELLTHGIDLEHWQGGHSKNPDAAKAVALPDWWQQAAQPRLLFWGLADRRLDATVCRSLAADEAFGSIVFVGPQQDVDPAVKALPRTVWPGPMGYADLPRLAAEADVLIMPYADLAVTRAMQPLKFKEYLATGKPVVARALPSIADWADAADLVAKPEAFVRACHERLRDGLPAAQAQARLRLADETWKGKAARFASLVLGH